MVIVIACFLRRRVVRIRRVRGAEPNAVVRDERRSRERERRRQSRRSGRVPRRRRRNGRVDACTDWASTPLGPAERSAAELENGGADHADLPPADLDRVGRGDDLSSITMPISRSSAASIPGRSAGRRRKSGARSGRTSGRCWRTAMGRDRRHLRRGTAPDHGAQRLSRGTAYTFSYSPIPDDDGTPGGIICANTRRYQARDRRAPAHPPQRTGGAHDPNPQLAGSLRAERGGAPSDKCDLPFAMIYMADPDLKTVSAG